MSATAEPLAESHCSVCGAVVGTNSKRCPECGLSLPTAHGAAVVNHRGLWMLGGVMLALYAVALIIVAAAR
jgi:predicted amidophosphoribosyltransferase